MKRLLFVLTLASVTLLSSKAQSTDQEIGLIGSILKSEIKVFFAQNIELATSEAELFWEIYAQYENDLKELSNQRISVLKAVLNVDEGLSAEELDKKIVELNKLNKKRQDLKFKYYKTLKKKISIKVASQFYQIDSYIHTHINASLNEGIPLILPTDK